MLIFLRCIASALYIIWRTLFTLTLLDGLFSFIGGLILLLAEIIGTLELVMHFFTLCHYQKPVKPQISDNEYPHVDIFIATFNEPAELLYKTINACNHLNYPDSKKIHIYLCDDGNRPTIEALAKDLGVHYLSRTEHLHAKAGNLNNALAHSNSPYILTLDADMIPMSDFLISVIPYFFQEKNNIGFFQTPQSFYNPDLFQYNLSAEQSIPN